MSEFASCYFCGTALDAEIRPYPVVPEGIAPDDRPTVDLCPTCHRKLTDILGIVLDAVGDADSVATTLDEYESESSPASEAGDPLYDLEGPDPAASATAGGTDAIGREADEGGDDETADAGDGGTASGSSVDEPDEEAAARSEATTGIPVEDRDESGTGADDDGSDPDHGGRDDNADDTGDEQSAPEAGGTDSGEPAAGADAGRAGDGSAAERNGGVSANEGTNEAGGDDAAEAGSEDESDAGGDEANETPAENSDGEPAERGDGESAEGEAEEADDGQPPVLSTPAANKVIRLLQNREFPVEREEFQVVAANAYDIPRQDCADVLDALVEEGYVAERGGNLVRPDG